MAEVLIKSGKVKINFVDPDTKTYSEDVGSLEALAVEGGYEIPDIANSGSVEGFGLQVREDINTLCNNIATLTESSLSSKIVTYEMEVRNDD